MSPAFFPKVGTILLIILSVLFTASSVRQHQKPQPKSNDQIGMKVKLNVFFIAASIALYLAALALVGFLVATPPVLVLLMVILGARLQHWISILITSAATTIAIYYFFIKTLGLPMP